LRLEISVFGVHTGFIQEFFRFFGGFPHFSGCIPDGFDLFFYFFGGHVIYSLITYSKYPSLDGMSIALPTALVLPTTLEIQDFFNPSVYILTADHMQGVFE